MNKLLNVAELSAYLRFTRRSIYKLLHDGAIPAVKIGNKWRFEKETIDRWIKEKTRHVKKRVLVIDDDATIRVLLTKSLNKDKCEVLTAENGTEGLELVKASDPDIVFLDLLMPGLGGDEVLREIRKINPNLTVVIITGYPESDMLFRALEYGPLSIIKKPFSPDTINAIVEKVSATL